MYNAGGQHKSILEPLVCSSSSSVSPRRTGANVSAPPPSSSRPTKSRLPQKEWRRTMMTEGCKSSRARRDPVSDLALVAVEDVCSRDEGYRRALTPLLSMSQTRTVASSSAMTETAHTTQRANYSDPSGLVRSTLQDSTEQEVKDVTRLPCSSLPCAGMCPVVFFVSAIDLFVANATSSSPSVGDVRGEAVPVTAYLVVSRPFLCFLSTKGELLAFCCVHHITSLTRCAANVLLIRRLTVPSSSTCAASPPSSSSPKALSTTGTDLVFCLNKYDETDFLLSLLARLAELPSQILRDTQLLASYATHTPLSDTNDAFPAWHLLEKPYTHVFTLTSVAQLLSSASRVALTSTLAQRLLPWLASSVAEALMPARLLSQFVEGGKDRFVDGQSKHDEVKKSEGMTTSVRRALAMLEVGAVPRPLIGPSLALSHDISAHQRGVPVGQVSTSSARSRPSAGTEWDKEDDEKWYFCFPEHHEDSSLHEEEITHTPVYFHDDEQLLYSDEDENVPDRQAVQALLAELQSQQEALTRLVRQQGHGVHDRGASNVPSSHACST